jgi:hypothetical protein
MNNASDHVDHKSMNSRRKLFVFKFDRAVGIKIGLN